MTTNDPEELVAHLRKSLDDVRMPNDVEPIVARGRALRRRRTAVSTSAMVSTAVVASLAVALSGGAPAPKVQATTEAHATTQAHATTEVHTHLAAWSVDVNTNKTVTVTVRELSDSTKLAELLAAAGVRTKVQFVQVPGGTFIGCYKLGRGLRSLPADQVISVQAQPGGDRQVTITITPAAMPPGSVLSFVIFGLAAGDNAASMDLYDGEPGPCLPIPRELWPSTGS